MIIYPTNFVFEKKENHIKFFIIIRDYYDEWFDKNNVNISIEFSNASYCEIRMTKNNKKVEFTSVYYSELTDFKRKINQAKNLMEK